VLQDLPATATLERAFGSDAKAPDGLGTESPGTCGYPGRPRPLFCGQRVRYQGQPRADVSGPPRCWYSSLQFDLTGSL
jgi:hypothetical protein